MHDSLFMIEFNPPGLQGEGGQFDTIPGEHPGTQPDVGGPKAQFICRGAGTCKTKENTDLQLQMNFFSYINVA